VNNALCHIFVLLFYGIIIAQFQNKKIRYQTIIRSLMTTPPSSEFSYDLYPGLDADLEAALARNIANGVADPGEVATSGLATVMGNVLNQPDMAPLAPEVARWADAEVSQAGASWLKYAAVLGPQVLNNPGALRESHPDFNRAVNRLYNAHQELLNSGYQTPEGTRIGETMKVVLVPWQFFRDHIGGSGMETALRQLRQEQQITEDYINDDLLETINNDKPLYQKPRVPGSLMTATEYLDARIAEDGPWGVMLAQTSNEAGLEHIKGQSPDQLTTTGGVSDNLRLKNIPVDAMGIFEWWALTLQEDPSQLSNSDYSWLLANRLDVDGVAQVPYGLWFDGQVDSFLFGAGNRFGRVRPRLAVI
jgi:hypothetical protein